MDRIKGTFDHLAKSVLIAVAAVSLQKLVKFCVVRCKVFLEQFVHRLSSQDQSAAVIADLKIRLNIDKVKIPANDLQRERVECADIRVRQQVQLLFQKHKIALQCGTCCVACRLAASGSCGRKRSGDPIDLFADRLLDLLFHLCRRRVRKRYDQHTVDRTALFQDQSLDALHQNSRLTGPCRRRYQQILPALRDRLCLLRGPPHSACLRCRAFCHVALRCLSHTFFILHPIAYVAHVHVSFYLSLRASRSMPVHFAVSNCLYYNYSRFSSLFQDGNRASRDFYLTSLNLKSNLELFYKKPAEQVCR